MKRFLVYLLILLAVLGTAGYFLLQAIEADKGYVLFTYLGFRYQSSIWAFIALVLVVLVALYLIRIVVRLILRSLGVINPWSSRNRSRRTQKAVDQGLMALAEGHWAPAQKHLTRAAKGDSKPLFLYLGAARAAQQLGRYEESENLLENALVRQPESELPIALAHAEFQSERGELDAAANTLQAMHSRHPGEPQVLRELAAVYERQRNWSALLGLMPELKKYKALPEPQLYKLERDTWLGRLHEAGAECASASGKDIALEPLTTAWGHLSTALRNEPELIAAYVEQLRRLNAQEQAEEVLRKALKHAYDSRLARFYGVVRGSDTARQLQTAENLLKAHAQDPALLLTLGRLCLQNKLWGKARDYFETSLRLERHPETCAELARLLSHQGELTRSNQLLLESMGLLHQGLPALPMPDVAQF